MENHESNEDVLNKIANGVYKISHKRKGRSQVWTVYGEIEKDDGTLLENVVYCRTCNHILKFNGKQTSNLVRHKCYIQKGNDAPLRKLNQEEKTNVLDACSEWMIEDCRPFSSLDGNGFRKMIQTFIKIGAKYGECLDIDDLLPHPSTVSRRVSIMAQDKRNELKPEIRKIIKEGRGSITADLWTDNFVKRNFLCATFHYLKNGMFKEMVLGVKSMDFTKSTGENIQNKMKSILAEFDVCNLDSITFVTDRGSNIISALKEHKRINCSNHLFANVLESAFDSTTELKPIVEACKKLVKYFKKANIQHLLPISLKSHCTTRWNSHLNMFQSILKNWIKINEILAERNEMHRLSDINLGLLNVLVELCENFEIISKKLQGTNYISISYVYPSINRLRKICEIAAQDASVISNLKCNILQQIDAKWIPNLNIYHKVASYLYPPTNSNMDENTISEIKNFCVNEIFQNEILQVSSTDSNNSASIQTSQIEQMPSCSNSTISPPISADSFELELSSPSHSREIKFFFPELLEDRSNSTISECAMDELERYSRVRVKIDKHFDAIQWWENHRAEYPKLSKLASKILSIPASSAASERAFSLAGNIIVEKRNRLVPRTVDSLLFLNSILKQQM